MIPFIQIEILCMGDPLAKDSPQIILSTDESLKPAQLEAILKQILTQIKSPKSTNYIYEKI